MQFGGRLLLGLGAAALLLTGCETAPATTATATAPATAQAATIATPFDPATADRLVAEHHWSALVQLHTELRNAEEIRRSLDWSRERLMSGGTIFIGLPYAANLWRVAGSAPAGDKLQELKDTSALIGLYGFAVILIDGYRCADKTSPGERVGEWIRSFRDPFRYAAALPKENRDKLVDTALRMESGIAARRENDPWLCGSGMQRMGAALDAMKQSGAAPQEVPTPPGGVGRTLVLPDPPGWAPTFVSREEAAPREEAARPNLPAVLHGLLDRIAARQGS